MISAHKSFSDVTTTYHIVVVNQGQGPRAPGHWPRSKKEETTRIPAQGPLYLKTSMQFLLGLVTDVLVENIRLPNRSYIGVFR